MKSKSVYVCCPGGSVTGGPELLHQFVDELRLNNIDAKILYYPFDKKFDIPDAYIKYNVTQGQVDAVSSSALVVIPEVATSLAKDFPNNQISIWWLSVDNFFGFKGVSPLKEKLKNLKRIVFRKRMMLCEMKSFIHLTQCQYASLFLSNNRITSYPLTDYLNQTHLDQCYDNTKRQMIIAYNPKKGIKVTQKLMDALPNIRFIPIQNMTALQVKELLQTAMLYIDFGLHPGKDRFPREAAMAGCCIITGRRGSAANSIDVPILQKYKLDENSRSFVGDFKKLVDFIFTNFDVASLEFESYREIIKNEPMLFKLQVKDFINIFCG